MHYVFGKGETPTVLRESCWRETTFKSLSAVSFSSLLGQNQIFSYTKLERLADYRPNHVGSSNKFIIFSYTAMFLWLVNIEDPDS